MKFWREQGNSAYQVEEIRQGDPYREEGHLEEEDHPFQDQVGKGAHLGDPSFPEGACRREAFQDDHLHRVRRQI